MAARAPPRPRLPAATPRYTGVVAAARNNQAIAAPERHASIVHEQRIEMPLSYDDGLVSAAVAADEDRCILLGDETMPARPRPLRLDACLLNVLVALLLLMAIALSLSIYAASGVYDLQSMQLLRVVVVPFSQNSSSLLLGSAASAPISVHCVCAAGNVAAIDGRQARACVLANNVVIVSKEANESCIAFLIVQTEGNAWLTSIATSFAQETHPVSAARLAPSAPLVPLVPLVPPLVPPQ